MSSSGEAASSPVRKPWPHYALWWLLAAVAAPTSLFMLLRGVESPVLLVLAGIVIICVLDIGTFTLPYSVLGPLRRTPLPLEPPLFGWNRSKRLYSNIAAVGASRATCVVYPSGIGFRLPLTGTAFIPLAYIDGLDKALFGRRVLLHHSPELRSYVYIGDPELIAFLESWSAMPRSPKI